MSFTTYVVNPREGLVRCESDREKGRASDDLVAVCRKAMDDPDEIDRAGCGLRVKWSSPPGVLSCWVDEQPVLMAVLLRNRDERHATQTLYETAVAVFSAAGIEPSSAWLDETIEFPCIVVLKLPYGTPEAHAIARDLGQAWAVAYFEADPA